MRIIMLGAPGAGKGTQAERLSRLLSIPMLTMSHVLKSVVSGTSALGEQIRAVMARGDLAPDDLIWQCLRDEIKRAKYEQGVIFDGVPRTLGQFDRLVADRMIVDKIFVLSVRDEVLAHRLTGRRMDPVTERVYHVDALPEDMTDAQKSRLVMRADDAPDVVVKRLGIYHQTTAPIIQAFKDRAQYKNAVVELDASLDKDTVWDAIKACVS